MTSHIYLRNNISVAGEIRDIKVKYIHNWQGNGLLYAFKGLSKFQTVNWDKKGIYRATVLSVLLVGAETWTIATEALKWLNAFHIWCVRTVTRCVSVCMCVWVVRGVGVDVEWVYECVNYWICTRVQGHASWLSCAHIHAHTDTHTHTHTLTHTHTHSHGPEELIELVNDFTYIPWKYYFCGWWDQRYKGEVHT